MINKPIADGVGEFNEIDGDFPGRLGDGMLNSKGDRHEA